MSSSTAGKAPAAGVQCPTHFKVALLTVLVICCFLYTSLLWRHFETSEELRISVAGAILILMYALMIFELVNRTLAALIGAAAAVAAYACLIDYVEMEEILQWQDLETLTLLFGMMIIVNVLSASGLFDFLAVWAYRKSAGRFWTLITIMAAITALLSALIDNVSTMLLMSPTIIKLSQLEHIDPRYLLIVMVLFCNIGGSATPVGDPPNLIIIGDPLIQSIGVTFSSFVAYCAPCVLVTCAAVIIYLKLIYKSKESFREFSKSYNVTAINNQQQQQQQQTAKSASTKGLSKNNSNLDSYSLASSGGDSRGGRPWRAELEQQLSNRLRVMNSIRVHLLDLSHDSSASAAPSLHGEDECTSNCEHPLTFELLLQQTELQIDKFQAQLKELQAEKPAAGSLCSSAPAITNQDGCVQSNSNHGGRLSLPTSSVDVEAASSCRRDSRITDDELQLLISRNSIKSKPILVQSLTVLAAAIVLFFLQSLPGTRLTLGWISLFAGLTLLVMSSSIRMKQADSSEVENHDTIETNGKPEKRQNSTSNKDQDQASNADSQGSEIKEEESEENFERVINNVEWSTLIFFFALFIVMHVMSKLGLIQFMGNQITKLIDTIPAGQMRSIAAITIILWSSGLASACIDNVPFTSMMIKVLGTMVLHNRSLRDELAAEAAPIKPLVFALTFGACYGGNGTLIGASANLVTAGVAGRLGYPISFSGFAKFAAPITILSLVISNIYLVLVFVIFKL